MARGPITTYGLTHLMPFHDPEDSAQYPVNLAPGTYLPGQVLGQVTDTEAGAVQTLTVTGTPTSGAILLTGQPFTSGAPAQMSIPFNATAAVAQAALDATYGAGNSIVSGGPLPATPLAVLFTGRLAAQVVAPIVVTSTTLAGGTTPGAAIAQTTIGASNAGLFKPYAHGNTDGSQVAKALLEYGCTVDAMGAIVISNELLGFSEPSVPAYYEGYFRTEHLVGLPTLAQMAVDFPNAFLRSGDLSSGLLHLA
jgi:hypothetical protein